jgi:hypothetical protein
MNSVVESFKYSMLCTTIIFGNLANKIIFTKDQNGLAKLLDFYKK